MNNVHIELAAYHEAAHAVVALYYGRAVKKIWVSLRGTGEGRTYYFPKRPKPAFTPTPGNIRAAWQQTFTECTAWIRILLAGPLAEAKLLKTPLRSLCAKSDLSRAQYEFWFLLDTHHYLWTRYCRLPEDVPINLLSKLRRQTRSLIARPAIWRMITQLASALTQRGILLEADIAAVIQAASGNERQSGLNGLFEHQENCVVQPLRPYARKNTGKRSNLPMPAAASDTRNRAFEVTSLSLSKRMEDQPRASQRFLAVSA